MAIPHTVMTGLTVDALPRGETALLRDDFSLPYWVTVQEVIYLSTREFSSLPRPLLFAYPILTGTIRRSQAVQTWVRPDVLSDTTVTRRTPADGGQISSPFQGLEGGSAKGRNDTTDPSSPSHSNNPTPALSDGHPFKIQLDFGSGEPMFPHFRIPLTERFNYASTALGSHTQGPQVGLCATKTAVWKERHLVIAELRQDIRIDIAQLANSEFSSGAFKDSTVA